MVTTMRADRPVSSFFGIRKVQLRDLSAPDLVPDLRGTLRVRLRQCMAQVRAPRVRMALDDRNASGYGSPQGPIGLRALLLEEFHHRLDGIRFGGGLVGTVALDASEAERETGRIAGRLLDVGEGDLGD